MSTNTWFTSDWHLGHESILKGFRNVGKNVEEFADFIIDQALADIKDGDNLYFLGDLFWKYSSDQKIAFFKKFKKRNINFMWILGNHDKRFVNSSIKFIGLYRDITVKGQPITLSHYPMIVWNKSHYGAWQLFGHIHLNDMTDRVMDYSRLGKQLNVNIDFHNFKVWSFDEVYEYMRTQPDNFDLIKRGKKYNG